MRAFAFSVLWFLVFQFSICFLHLFDTHYFLINSTRVQTMTAYIFNPVPSFCSPGPRSVRWWDVVAPIALHPDLLKT